MKVNTLPHNSIDISTKELLQLILHTKSTTRLHALLTELLTPNELQEIPMRWQIIKELVRGTPQREIATKLKVGIATVTRGARELQNPKSILRQLAHKK